MPVLEDCALEAWSSLVEERQRAFQKDRTVAVSLQRLKHVSRESQ